MAAFDPIPPAIKNADVQLDGDVVRVRWFTEGVPSGPGTMEWSARISVAGTPEYLLRVRTVDGVGQSSVTAIADDGEPQQVAEPGELDFSEMGLGTTFPRDLLPKLDGSSTYTAALTIDGEQVDVFPADGSGQQVMTL